MVSCGVLSLGEVGPKAPMELGVKRAQWCWRATSSELFSAPHVDVPRHLGIPLANGREQRHEVENRIDVITGHHGGHGRSVEGVEHFEGAGFTQSLALAHVGCDHVGAAVNVTQVDRQFGTNLAAGAYYQDSFHLFEIMVWK